MSTIENRPETRELEKAAAAFTDQLQGIRASNSYDDSEAPQVLIPLYKAPEPVAQGRTRQAWGERP